MSSYLVNANNNASIPSVIQNKITENKLEARSLTRSPTNLPLNK
jgi:hypothetical protein